MFSKKIKPYDEDILKKEESDDWIWIEGYKGTDKDMTCRGFPFELKHRYVKTGEIKMCENGFHLCLKLENVFDYYPVGSGNRFFKVRALVRKDDMDKIVPYRRYDKMVAKSIEFIEELSADEICGVLNGLKDLPQSYKELALKTDAANALIAYRVQSLIEFGYSKPFADYIIKQNKYDVAYAVGSQSDLSMDMKVSIIFNN